MKSSKKVDFLVSVIQPSVNALGLELWGIEYHHNKPRSILRVYIDKPGEGVTVDDCAAASHQISGVLDVEDPIDGQYRLEVSSPGIDRTLFSIAHFEAYLGKQVSVKLMSPIEGRRNFKGTIRSAADAVVALTLADGTEIDLPTDEIEKAQLVPVL